MSDSEVTQDQNGEEPDSPGSDTDFILNIMLELTDKFEMGFPLTLYMNGSIITGTLISGSIGSQGVDILNPDP